MRACRLLALLAVLGAVAPASGSDFAVEVVGFSGPFDSSPYDDPDAVLGKPSTEVYDPGFPPFQPTGTVTPSLVYAAWNTDTQGNKLVTTLGPGAEIIVRFDHDVIDHPGNWYGQDFIVYGNAFFSGQGTAGADTNMEQFYLTDGGVNAEPVTVSVSSDGASWFTFSAGPRADSYFPTNPFAWDRSNDTWGEELDWTKPVDPALGSADFADRSAADAIDLYDRSAGGTSFDLAGLAPADYDGLGEIEVDLGKGVTATCKYIRYVRVACLSDEAGEVDGLSDVAVDPDYDPLPGDLNDDWFVGQTDLDIVLDHWGLHVDPGDRLMGDPSGDGFVGQADLDTVLDDWGRPVGPNGGAAAPEPAAAATLLLGGLTLLRRLGRRSS